MSRSPVPRFTRTDPTLPDSATRPACQPSRGVRTLLGIAEWIQDGDRGVLPSESTIRRSLALLDADDLDVRMGAWMATRVGHLAGHG